MLHIYIQMAKTKTFPNKTNKFEMQKSWQKTAMDPSQKIFLHKIAN